MLNKILVLGLFIFKASLFLAQDTVVMHSNHLNSSIANRFTIYESIPNISFKEFLFSNKPLKKKKLRQRTENLDFTSSRFFIHFVLENPNTKDLDLTLETARPITNIVELYDVKNGTSVKSGDGISFELKNIQSNRCLLSIKIPAKSTKEYVLKLVSDGEIISLPVIFWERENLQSHLQREQFFFGIFYGVFLFVIIIYSVFYILLKDRLFLVYSIYVLLSGLMQFSLDGYLHQYILVSGGYLTQHSVILLSGLTVFSALWYATLYLNLQGAIKKVTMYFGYLVLGTLLLSLIPGKMYEISYPLINGLSFLFIFYLLIVAYRIRAHNKSVSPLFLFGLFSLMLGGIIFILGNFSVIDRPSITQNSLKAGSLIEIICLSILMAGKYKSLQDDKREIQQRLFNELKEKNDIIAQTNIRLEEEVVERTQEIESQKELLKEKNKDILASIKYAERIQSTILPTKEERESLLPESFVFFKPKDVLSGDFYWIKPVSTSDTGSQVVLFAVVDCTGHGVPGAFLSLIGSNFLKLSLTEPAINNPAEALDFLNLSVKETLTQGNKNDIRDGMDAALCAWFKRESTLSFAGAKNPLYVIKNNELREIKGDKQPIGGNESAEQKPFTNHNIKLEGGECIYIFTDGFIDQFGGPENKRFMSKRLKALLLEIHLKPMHEQRELLEKSFHEWRGSEEQIDDVCIMGVRF